MESLIFAESEPSEKQKDIYIMVICLLIILYVMFQSVIEHKKITLIHETGLGILLGVLFGFLLYEEKYITDFSGEFFFIYILPPIIFAGGYNLKKDKFFKNIFYIVLYAVIGTIVNFLITLAIMIPINNSGLIYTNNGEQIKMDDSRILYFASTMCASDAIAALTLISSDKYPKLFSIVFGEGLLNDAVAIILFHSVSKIAGDDKKSTINTGDAFMMIANFLTTCLASISIGLVIGFLVTYLFRKIRTFYHNAVTEVVLILLFGYVAYVASEALGQSGVIALLTCGILMSHYLTYNLSPTGVISSAVTLQTISQIAEAFLFIYLGISFWFYFSPKKFGDTSMGFIGFGFMAVIIARICCIFLTSGVAYLFKRKSWKVNIYELSIIWFAGLIRGAVAFALIQTAHVDCEKDDKNCNIQNQILKSSIMAIVFFTTIVLGGFMPCYVKVHIKKLELKQALERLRSESVEVQQTEPLVGEDQEANSKRLDEQKEEYIKKKYKNRCIRLFKRVDENYIKPFLIYRYRERRIEIQDQKKLIKDNREDKDAHTTVKSLARLQNKVFQQSAIESIRQSKKLQDNNANTRENINKNMFYSSINYQNDNEQNEFALNNSQHEPRKIHFSTKSYQGKQYEPPQVKTQPENPESNPSSEENLNTQEVNQFDDDQQNQDGQQDDLELQDKQN